MTPAALDARDEAATARLLEGHDAVSNCVTYYLNVPIMRAALAARVPYCRPRRAVPRLDEAVRAARRLRRGRRPGPSRHGLDAGDHQRHGGRARARARFGRGDPRPRRLPRPLGLGAPARSPTPSTPCSTSSRSSRWCSAAAGPSRCAPMSGREAIDFPPPVGRAEALYTLHSEVAMFPRSFPGLREASFKVAFEPEFTEKVALPRGARLRVPREGRRSVSPRDVLLALAAAQTVPPGAPQDCDALRVDLEGRRNGALGPTARRDGRPPPPRMESCRGLPRHRRAALDRRAASGEPRRSRRPASSAPRPPSRRSSSSRCSTDATCECTGAERNTVAIASVNPATGQLAPDLRAAFRSRDRAARRARRGRVPALAEDVVEASRRTDGESRRASRDPARPTGAAA